MKGLMKYNWILLCLLITTSLLVTEARRGGGSRGGSRGSSSRGSSSKSSSSSRTTYDRSRDRGAPAPAPRPAPAPPPPPPPPPKPKTPTVVRQPAENPNFKDTNVNRQPAYNPNQQKPPPYSPRENPPPYSPPGGQGPPPPYSPQGRPPNYQQTGNVQPPPYSPPQGGVPAANYPRQPGINPSPGVGNPQQGVPGANYPRQPGINPSQGVGNPQQGVPGANYPRQPGINPSQGVGYPQQGVPGANYPRQPGINPSQGVGYPQQGVYGSNYPRQPGTFPHGAGGIPGANYPRQQYAPPNTLGSNVWHPQSGAPSPAYMKYGGLPTGANMYTQPMQKQGMVGSLMSMGSNKPYKSNKYFGSRPSPYVAGGVGLGVGLLGGYAASRAMHTILPYGARSGSSLFMPRMGYMPMFLPSPFYSHHYHHYHHNGYNQRYTDVYNNEYAGKCNRPLPPDHGNVTCISDYKQVECAATCEDGYRYQDNSSTTENKCWHVTGVWRPQKNFSPCQPVCNQTCLNGGSCIAPGVCGCQPEYRGPHCEFYFLNCDVRKLAPSGTKISWVCTHSKNETSCRVKCRPPQVFAAPIADKFKCSPDGTWTPQAMPDCVSPASLTSTATEESTTLSEAPNNSSIA